MQKKKVTRPRAKRSKSMDCFQEYLYSYATLKDGQEPHEKYKDITSILFYYQNYSYYNKGKSLKEYITNTLIPYYEAKDTSKLQELEQLLMLSEKQIKEKVIKEKTK